MTNPHTTAIAACIILVTSTLGCAVPTGTDEDEGPTTYVKDGVWVTVSWGGGGTGAPSDRRDITDPGLSTGDHCPRSNITFRKVRSTNIETEAFVLADIACNPAPDFYLCLNKGSVSQPAGGIGQCAPDPLLTDWDRLDVPMLGQPSPGPNRYIIRTWHGSSVTLNVFYCHAAKELYAPPLSKRVSCQ